MPDLAQMKSDLENLRSIRAKGIRRYEIGDREMEYRSDAELAAAIADLEHRIARAEGRSRRVTYPRLSKGV